MQTWSTSARISDPPFGSWADNLAAAFVPLEPERIADAPFRGRIAKSEAGPVRISFVEATCHRVLRRRTHISRGGGDVFFVNLQLEGLSASRQRGAEQICGPGDIAVLDTTEPFEIANGRDFSLFCLEVPRLLLPSGLLAPPRLSLSPQGRAFGRIVAGYAELCMGADAATAQRCGAQMLDLLQGIDVDMLDRRSAGAGGSALLDRLLRHIDERFTDETLDATRLAARFGVSPRYVHKVFRVTGRSVGEHIAERRLLACERHLRDVRLPRQTIAAIAFAAGFRDISHFNRLFRRRHGTSPRGFRRLVSGESGGSL